MNAHVIASLPFWIIGFWFLWAGSSELSDIQETEPDAERYRPLVLILGTAFFLGAYLYVKRNIYIY